MLSTDKKYDRAAKLYDFFTSAAEKKWYSKWRREFFTPLTGKILEVGIGTGKSLPSYDEEAEVTGIDFSKKMLQRSRQKLADLERKNITLKEMNVESLDFPDNSFDYVLTSCVLCSVPRCVRALGEMRRVVKPEGRVIMLEHVLSRNRLIAAIEHIHNPFTRLLLGVNVNRDTQQNIIKAGMEIVEEKNLALADVFRLFVAKSK